MNVTLKLGRYQIVKAFYKRSSRKDYIVNVASEISMNSAYFSLN